jgi:DNA modification methylase
VQVGLPRPADGEVGADRQGVSGRGHIRSDEVPDAGRGVGAEVGGYGQIIAFLGEDMPRVGVGLQPTYKSERVTIYCGNCENVLSSISSVDTIIADIPYAEVNRDSGGLRNLDKGDADDETFSAEYVVKKCTKIASGSIYIFCGIEQVSPLRGGFVDAGMTTRLCVWEKSNPSPMNGDRLWLSSIECCVFARYPNAYFGSHCESPVWRGPVERDQVHPTQKPLWLMEKLVEASVSPNGVCLDFCMGSGSTGVAAVKLGRKFIGIEKNPDYCNIAIKRIGEAEFGRPILVAPPKRRMI